jgi:hypothetical protein
MPILGRWFKQARGVLQCPVDHRAIDDMISLAIDEGAVNTIFLV